MPCMNRCRQSGPFIQYPSGYWEKINPLKNVNIHLGQPRDYERCEPSWGMSVDIQGLETYDQVKDLVGYVHSLWEKSNGR